MNRLSLHDQEETFTFNASGIRTLIEQAWTAGQMRPHYPMSQSLDMQFQCEQIDGVFKCEMQITPDCSIPDGYSYHEFLKEFQTVVTMNQLMQPEPENEWYPDA